MVSPLAYAELLDPNGTVGILPPNQIPVHPAVYNFPLAFTEEYIYLVRDSLPESIRKDIEEINRVLGKYDGLRATNKALIYGTKELQYDQVLFRFVSGTYVEAALGSSNIALDRREGQRRELQLEGHPMGRQRLEKYAFESQDGQPRIHTWYVHNYLDHGLPLKLYFRNFAIMFNNLGVE